MDYPSAVAFSSSPWRVSRAAPGAGFPAIVDALARGMARLSAPSGTMACSCLRRVAPRLRIDHT
eukprot:5993594-Pyramimonas_sp.AAC.1